MPTTDHRATPEGQDMLAAHAERVLASEPTYYDLCIEYEGLAMYRPNEPTPRFRAAIAAVDRALRAMGG